jgi:ATP-binding cassette subfamily C (CFTR/MRP) protein 4
LLLAILNEIQNANGKVDIQGSMFYVPQEPWLFPATIKRNILFGKEFDSNKFKLALKFSCFDKV